LTPDRALGLIPGSLTFGFLPVIPLLVAQLLVMAVVSAVTKSPSREIIDEYRSLFDGQW